MEALRVDKLGQKMWVAKVIRWSCRRVTVVVLLSGLVVTGQDINRLHPHDCKGTAGKS